MRRLEVSEAPPGELEVELLAIPVERSGEEVPAGRRGPALELGGEAAARLLERGAFRGEEGESWILPRPAGPDLLLVGLGEEGLGPEGVRRASGAAIRAARRARARSVAFLVPAASSGEGPDEEVWQSAAEGLILGDWSYDELRGPEARARRGEPPERVALVAPAGGSPPSAAARSAAERGRIVADAQNRARELVASPANVMTPRRLEAVARELAEERGLRFEAWGPERLRGEGFGALLAVARGSAEEPRFLVLEHAGEGGAPWCVIGKGVTFDSGGISLKPADGMESMKYDMAGAAAVYGVLRAVAELGSPHRVIGLVPAAENLPSGSALKPGDVIRGLSGRSIEVVNTDAEGRLLLSDALTFASRLEPRAVVDVATLTGGVVVALGRHAIGLMTPDDGLAAELEAAGRRTGERVWRLPLWREYRKQLDSEIADIKNSGGREGSPVTAGCFLGEFAGEARWAHLDIAGAAWAEEEGRHQPKGATGVGVRLLVDWLRHGD